MTSIQMPPLGEAQKQAWHALMDLYERLSHGWTLVGGQLVHLYCAEHGVAPTRPTADVDAVVNVRSEPTMLAKFTEVLKDMRFEPVTTGEGFQHRWTRDLAQIDVLIPEGVGERAAARLGAESVGPMANTGEKHPRRLPVCRTIMSEHVAGRVATHRPERRER